MKPVDRQKGKCGSSQSWTPKYTTNADLTSDAYWKYPQGKNLTVPLSRSRSPTAAEQMANYYAAKVHKNHGASKPSYFPHIPTRSADAAHRIPEKYMTCNREKYYAPSAAPLRRSRYEPDTENENEKEYGEVETDNLTEDVGEDAGEEAEEDAEGLCEYADKECEDHEADDEIDEESDASPQARRTSRPLSKDALQRAQRWKAMEQEDPRRYRGYDQRISAGQCHPSQARRYYSPERELQEPLTDEEIAAAAANPRNPRRSPMDYYNWQQSRSYIDHYDPTTFPIHRRARTKLEIDSPFDLEFARAKKCSRCGYVPNKKTPLTNKHNCRFDDRLRFYAKGSIGDEFRDDTFHGCNAQSPTNCDYPSSAPCTMDSRRSREVKSPSYEAPEHDRLLNKIPTDQAPPRRYTREASEASPDKNKRFVAPAYGSTRLPSRF